MSANDGPTHHGLFDIAYLRCVPNLIAMAPKDEDELVDMMFTATRQPHPVFIRYPRGAAEGVRSRPAPKELEIGKAEVLQPFARKGGRKVAFFALGNMQQLARDAAELLAAEGFDFALINPRFTKPLDAATHELSDARRTWWSRSKITCWPAVTAARARALVQPPHVHPGRPHRLARPVHRARHHRANLCARSTA